MNKIVKYFLSIWFLLNVGLFIGSGNFLLKDDNTVFFPFGETIHGRIISYPRDDVYTIKSAIDIKDYDYTEFLVYAIFIPAFALTILLRKNIINFFNNRISQIKKNKSSNISNSLLGAKNLESRSNKMYKQRIGIIIAAAIGALGTFLPWVHAPIIGSVPGSYGSDGWITFILFVITIGLCFVGKRTEPLKLGFLVGAIIPSLLASIVALIKIIDFNSQMGNAVSDNPFSKAMTQTVGIGIGLYLIVLAGIAVLLVGIFLNKSTVPAESIVVGQNEK